MPSRSPHVRASSRLLPVLAAAVLAGTTGAGARLHADDYDFGRAGFGAFTIPVPLDVQAEQDLVPGQGVLVVAVRPGGTASELGVEPGDVLTSLNNTPVASRHDIREVVAGVQPGDAASASVIQADGTTATLSGTFQARPNRWGGLPPGPPPDAAAIAAALPPGVEPQDALAEQRRELLSGQSALSEVTDLLAQLRARLCLWPSGAWRVQFTLAHPPATPMPAAAVAAVTSDAVDRMAVDGASSPEAPAAPVAPEPPWALHGDLAIGQQR